ncbi:MAG: M13 family metallopeptidase [Elusimicrobia bacterium]|nr:M13 family metallopeptidase [Elusimicrobiota bacterium]
MTTIALLLSAAQLAWAAPAPKTIPGFDSAALDKGADPCSDFFQFACGGWLKNNEIPPDQSSWGRFRELTERNRETLHGILEKAASKDAKRDPLDRKIGDYYASCMDETAVEKKGLEPLKGEFARIEGISGAQQLPEEFARLHGIGVRAAFAFGSTQDYKDASMQIAEADQGGLGLPDRDYYTKTDAKSEEQRRQYVEHVYKMLRLLGEDEPKAAADAETVLRFETRMAQAAQTLVFRRDPDHIYHRMTKTEFSTLAPGLAWDLYFAQAGAPAFSEFNVVAPDYFKEVSGAVSRGSLDEWKTYLRWHLVHAHAGFLPKAFVEEDFDFYGRKLAGAKELKARWKRCVEATDAALGEALGQRFVELTFGPQGKERTSQMVAALEGALKADISGLGWMTPKTKEAALSKLQGIANKIGYPEKYRDYSALSVVRGDALGNLQRARSFEFKRQLAKIGKPVDRQEWDMTPPTVNAYYNPQMNDINFPAGILQPPFYDNALDDAVNFGAIGGVIGHELTHGFDDEGRKFDAKGNLTDWWTPEDAKAFEGRAQCLVDEYAGFTAVEGVKLNGKLTLGENTADNGGLRLASMALQDTIADKLIKNIDGFTPQQRLFLGWGQVWCEKRTDEAMRMLALTNPHSPGRYRVNGVVSNMPEFARAFSCPAGRPLTRPKACRVW